MMLQRNLMYSALTRARKRAAIVVSDDLEHKQTGVVFKGALEAELDQATAASLLRPISGDSEEVTVEPTQTPSEARNGPPWWRFRPTICRKHRRHMGSTQSARSCLHSRRNGGAGVKISHRDNVTERE
jgi:hypothetical protein